MTQNQTWTGQGLSRAMIRIGASLLLAVSVLISAPAIAEPDVQQVVSPGGIRAWLIQSDTLPAVTLSLTFNGGSNQDPADKPGAAYFVDWMINEGAGDMDAQALLRAFKRSGSDLSRDLTNDSYTIVFTALNKTRDAAFDLLRQMLVTPRFDPDAMMRARRDILYRIEASAKNPGSQLGKAWREAVFDQHPYRNDTIGTAETANTITPEDLRAYRSKVFTRDNLLVSVVGDIDAATLAPLLDKIFGELPAKSDLKPVPRTRSTPARQIAVEMDLAQSQVLFGYAFDEKFDNRALQTAGIVSHILGGSMISSRLATEVRVKRGLVYAISWSMSDPLHGEYATGYFGADPAAVDGALALIRQELKRLAEEGPTDKEIADTKTYLQGSFLMNLDTSRKLAMHLQGLQQHKMSPDSIETYASRIESITPEEIRSMAKTILKPDGLTTVIVGRRPPG